MGVWATSAEMFDDKDDEQENKHMEGSEIIKVVEGQLVVGHELNQLIVHLASEASAIVVHDADTYSDALEVCKKSLDAQKMVMAAAEPRRLELRRQLDELLKQRDAIIVRLQSVVSQKEKEARDWNFAERKAAADEQAKINKGQRAENRVSVAPNIPAVPGKRIIPHYRYKVLDLAKVKREYLIDNATKINEKLRKDANIQKSEKEIGGVKVWIE
jgi:hypothetical protein